MIVHGLYLIISAVLFCAFEYNTLILNINNKNHGRRASNNRSLVYYVVKKTKVKFLVFAGSGNTTTMHCTVKHYEKYSKIDVFIDRFQRLDIYWT